jgi:hypothetical protein
MLSSDKIDSLSFHPYPVSTWLTRRRFSFPTKKRCYANPSSGPMLVYETSRDDWIAISKTSTKIDGLSFYFLFYKNVQEEATVLS